MQAPGANGKQARSVVVSTAEPHLFERHASSIRWRVSWGLNDNVGNHEFAALDSIFGPDSVRRACVIPPRVRRARGFRAAVRGRPDERCDTAFEDWHMRGAVGPPIRVMVYGCDCPECSTPQMTSVRWPL